MPRKQPKKRGPVEISENVENFPAAGKKVKVATKAPDEEEEEISHWLMKSEPESRFENGIDVKFGVEDLKECPDQTACWDGVRNYQARNFLRDKMKKGHQVFFYHSNTKQPGICAICEVAKEGYVDHTQFDPKDPHYDKEEPRWYMVDVKFRRMTQRYIPLAELKALHGQHKQSGGALRDLSLFTRARLSVQPISQEEWDFILSLETTPAKFEYLKAYR
ncbi:THYN1-like protein [Mya arenaria]|uniref:Thymocyte nuclear protein 1 n=1 Tax=Mya arenaria TaxID=6604 RepID=A0ABY7E3G5_MYAAR|nr:THYN1-like protein [Mya arenaria]